jgi:UPF0716 protein FxsA
LVVLLVFFLVLPFVELFVIVQVSDQIGLFWTFASLVAISIAGAWLVKREGLGVMRRINAQLNAGQLPTTEFLDGGLIMLAGAMMLVPGFVTDALGLLLLLPPVRAGVRALIASRLRRRVDAAAATGGPAGFVFSRSSGFGPGGFSSTTVFVRGDVFDTTGAEADPVDRGPGPDDRGDPWARELGGGR